MWAASLSAEVWLSKESKQEENISPGNRWRKIERCARAWYFPRTMYLSSPPSLLVCSSSGLPLRRCHVQYDGLTHTVTTICTLGSPLKWVHVHLFLFRSFYHAIGAAGADIL